MAAMAKNGRVRGATAVDCGHVSVDAIYWRGNVRSDPKIHWNPLRCIFVLAVAAFFFVAVHEHLFSVNSHYYFAWNWQWIASKTVYPVMLPVAIPFFLGQLIYIRRPSFVAPALALIMLSSFGLMIAGAMVQNNPPDFSRIPDVIRSTLSTGYFSEAAKLLRSGMSIREILARYPALVGKFYLHPQTKPPGPIIFELAVIRLFGSGRTGAMASGLLIGIVGSFSIVATYVFIRRFTADKDAAFFGASYLALCPSLVLFFPQFDQCYPIFTAGIAVLWDAALLRNNLRYSIALGIFYAIAAFVTYLPGVLVIFLVGLALVRHLNSPHCSLARIFRHFLTSLGTFVACYLIFWVFTGFNALATFQACNRQVNILWNYLEAAQHMPHHALPGTIPADLYDFALGSGWISYLLILLYLTSNAGQRSTPQSRIAWLCVIQFVMVALTGMLQTEASRVWLFMFPMLMLPIGLELANWKPWARLAVFGALLMLTIAMCQSMQFASTAN
jgi:hypothetical protein